MNSLRRAIPVIQEAAWAFFLLTLPVTSFPYFPSGLGGKTLIRPLSVFPLLVLLLLVTLPRLFTRPLPKTFLPLLAFAIVSLLSSVLAFTLNKEALRGVSMAERIIRNLITLGIGGAIYTTVVLMPSTWRDMRRTLVWLYAGFAIALLWGSLQAIYVLHFNKNYFHLLSEAQAFISTRRLFETRISGMTYEPKWFADQICFLLLPWLSASVILRRSIFSWRFRRITVEWILLFWALGVLLFTFSRTGLVMALAIGATGLLFNRWLVKRRQAPRSSKPRTRLNLVKLLAIAALIGIAVWVMAQNPYFSRLWRYWTSEDVPGNKTYLEYIAFSQRFAYWDTAYQIYADHPLFGVGLGNYAFFFADHLANQPWDKLPEIVRQLTPTEGAQQLITPKNLYARLLAETGLVGTIVFTTFLLAVFGCVLYLAFQGNQEAYFWALGGVMGMVVFAIAVFSFDSFAFPNMWVVFGLITAAAHLPAERCPETEGLPA